MKKIRTNCHLSEVDQLLAVRSFTADALFSIHLPDTNKMSKQKCPNSSITLLFSHPCHGKEWTLDSFITNLCNIIKSFLFLMSLSY